MLLSLHALCRCTLRNSVEVSVLVSFALSSCLVRKRNTHTHTRWRSVSSPGAQQHQRRYRSVLRLLQRLCLRCASPRLSRPSFRSARPLTSPCAIRPPLPLPRKRCRTTRRSGEQSLSVCPCHSGSRRRRCRSRKRWPWPLLLMLVVTPSSSKEISNNPLLQQQRKSSSSGAPSRRYIGAS